MRWRTSLPLTSRRPRCGRRTRRFIRCSASPTSTLILADGSLVITDTSREAADYRRMGLPVQQRSLHYRQADGWSHAIDLRTSGRAAWQNAWMQVYFEAMGFQTLRHVGTADHLHVALPVQ